MLFCQFPFFLYMLHEYKKLILINGKNAGNVETFFAIN